MLSDYEKLSLYIHDLFEDNELDNPILVKFLNFIKKNEGFKIDISKKVKGNSIYQKRIVLRYLGNFNHNNVKQNFDECMELLYDLNSLDNINLDLNDALSCLNTKEPYKLTEVVVGFDLREKIEDSRIKLWLDLVDCPNITYNILAKHGYNSEMLNLVNKENIFLGIDFFCNGKYSLKVHHAYRNLSNNSLQKEKMKEYFNNATVEAMLLCDFHMIAFREHDYKKFLYLGSDNMREIIDVLGIEKIDDNILNFNDLLPGLIGVFYPDIISGTLKEFNLYYEL